MAATTTVVASRIQTFEMWAICSGGETKLKDAQERPWLLHIGLMSFYSSLHMKKKKKNYFLAANTRGISCLKKRKQ